MKRNKLLPTAMAGLAVVFAAGNAKARQCDVPPSPTADGFLPVKTFIGSHLPPRERVKGIAP